MFDPTRRVREFRLSVLQPKKLPKMLVTIFVLAQLFTGINFGFFAVIWSKRLRTFANILSALSGLLMVTSFIYFYSKWDYVEPAFVAEYLFALIAMRSSKYTIFNFLTDLMEIDDTFNIKLNSRFALKTSICVIFACFYRIILTSFYCVYIGCFENGTISLIMYVFYEMRHLISLFLAPVHFIVYYVIYLRVKFLNLQFGQGELETKQAAMIFKALSDCFKNVNVYRDALIVTSFMTDFMKGVGYFWFALKLLSDFSGIWVLSMNIILFLLLTCVPPLAAEMISAQIDDMKLLIHEQLHSGSNGFDDEDLLRLLRYVEARPLVRAAWRLVPVDLRLPISLLSMTATYVIVLVQLTHLY